jgi:hypothetical protein
MTIQRVLDGTTRYIPETDEQDWDHDVTNILVDLIGKAESTIFHTVSVKEPAYGAQGDGLTEDTDAINAAIDAIPTSGGTLYFPPGVYLVDWSAVTIDKSNLTVLGAPGAVLKLMPDFNYISQTFRIVGGTEISDIKIIGMTFDGNWANRGVGEPVDSTQAHAIYVKNVRRLWIENCYIHDVMGDGICIDPGDAESSEIFIRNNVINHVMRNGISVVAGYKVLIDGNVIDGFNTDGIDLEPDQDDNCRFITITHNFCKPNSTYENTHNTNRLYGISLKMDTPGASDKRGSIKVIGNTVQGITDTGVQYPNAGIWMQKCRSAIVQGNNLFECGVGIYSGSDSASDGSTGSISGNVVRGCKGSSSFGIGVYSHMAVVGNVCEDGDNGGIYLYRDGNTCSGNICRNNGKGTTPSQPYGIMVEGTTGEGNLVFANRCYDDQAVKTQTHGIYIVNSTTGCVIESNDVYGNATAGIRTVANNTVRNNRGFATEGSGTGAITSGNTAATITHGLDITPRAQDITVTPTATCTADPGNIWVDTVGATTFAVNCRTNPSTSGMAFAWKVNAKE